MRIDVLKEFVILGQVLHYRKAAARLNVSQSALSRHIRELEANLGTQLLDRTRHGVALTEAGQAFLEEIRLIPASYERAVDLTRRVGLGLTETLRVGHIGPGSLQPLAELMSRWTNTSPPLHIQLIEGTSSTLREHLQDHRLDLALLRPPLHEADLEEAWLLDDPPIVLIPRHHPLAARSILRLRDLRSESLTLPAQAASGAHDRLRARCAAERIAITDVEASSGTSLAASVLGGSTLAIVPASAANGYHELGLVTVRLDDDEVTFPLHIAWRRSDQNPMLIQSVLHLQQAPTTVTQRLREVVRTGGDGSP